MSMFKVLLVLAAVFHGVLSSDVVKKDRVIGRKLSDEDPGTVDYDHEAFLGEETSKKFDKLSLEESKRRLGIIADKIDTDHDGIVTEEELEKWISFTQERYVNENTEKEFKKYDKDEDGKIDWKEYYNITFGILKDENDWKIGEDQGFSYKDMHHRDRKRWEAADTDDDNSCTKHEYKAFLHPQEFEHMKEVVLDETMDDVDRNKDGVLDLEEYIRDVYRPSEDGEIEPDWVATEREQFVLYRDKDKDGSLNKEEVKEWIMPKGYNNANAEAKHLIYESDSDKDGVLTKKEIIEHHEVFVGSQATDWGEIFNKHDEF